MENPEDWLSDDPKAVLKHIYNLNYPWLEKHIRKNSGTAEDAQDIFQESLVAAWVGLKAGRFSGSQDSFNAYLRQICKYKWITHIRSAAHQRTLYTEDMTVFEREAEDASYTEEGLLQARQLKGSIEQLGKKCREILGAFYYERQSLAQIAIAQQNTEESIKTIKYRCIMQLRKIYLEHHKENGEV